MATPTWGNTPYNRVDAPSATEFDHGLLTARPGMSGGLASSKPGKRGSTTIGSRQIVTKPACSDPVYPGLQGSGRRLPSALGAAPSFSAGRRVKGI